MGELDRIYEAAVADDWEEQNKPESESFPKWKEATEKLTRARVAIYAAVGLISEAAEMVEGSTQEDRIASLASTLEDTAATVANQIERMAKA